MYSLHRFRLTNTSRCNAHAYVGLKKRIRELGEIGDSHSHGKSKALPNHNKSSPEGFVIIHLVIALFFKDITIEKFSVKV